MRNLQSMPELVASEPKFTSMRQQMRQHRTVRNGRAAASPGASDFLAPLELSRPEDKRFLAAPF